VETVLAMPLYRYLALCDVLGDEQREQEARYGQ
jgi:hypothetical protein